MDYIKQLHGYFENATPEQIEKDYCELAQSGTCMDNEALLNRLGYME